MSFIMGSELEGVTCDHDSPLTQRRHVQRANNHMLFRFCGGLWSAPGLLAVFVAAVDHRTLARLFGKRHVTQNEPRQ